MLEFGIQVTVTFGVTLGEPKDSFRAIALGGVEGNGISASRSVSPW